MPNKSTVEKLIERTPLAVVIVGVIVFIIGAAGGLPIGNPPLQVTDLAWRIGLGTMGLILVVAGLLLLVREKDFFAGNQKNGSTQDKSFFVKTYPRSQHPAFFAEVEKLVPRAKNIILIATGLNLIWEKRIVDLLIERAKSGEAKIIICMGNPFSPHVLDS